MQPAAADPIDPALRALASQQGLRFRDLGTIVVIDGARSGTLPESRWHPARGGEVVNTTLTPELPRALEPEMAL